MIGDSEDVLWPPTEEVAEKSDETEDEKEKSFGFDNSENASVLYRQLGIQVEKGDSEKQVESPAGFLHVIGQRPCVYKGLFS